MDIEPDDKEHQIDDENYLCIASLSRMKKRKNYILQDKSKYF